jgi:CDP-diacylglycerol--glycerol-3-phosphate 3-phosphatidyltransferase
MTRHLPNALTAFRMAAIPIIVFLLYFDNATFHIIAAVLFALASISDYLDGYLARKWDVISVFGKSFDSIADKMLVLTVMMMLIHLDRAYVIPCVIILSRELIISGLREFLSVGNQRAMPVSKVAKYKTTVQLLALFILILPLDNLMFFGNLVLSLAALLAVISGYNYLRGAFTNPPQAT